MYESKDALPSRTLKIKGPVSSGSKIVYEVCGTLRLPQKETIRKRFDSKSEASEWIRDKDQIAYSCIINGDTRYTLLTPAQQQEAFSAYLLLQNCNCEQSLLSAIASYVNGKTMEHDSDISVDEALVSFKESFLAMGNTQRHVDSTFLRLERFTKAWSGDALNDMDRKRIEEWILCRTQEQKGPWNNRKRGKIKPSERTKEKAALSIFFNHCVGKGWIKNSPVDGIKIPKPTSEELSLPEIYTPDQAEELLQASLLLDKHNFDKVSTPSVPFFVLSLFCGLRPAEVQRLDWKDFIWNEDGTVEIRVSDKRSSVKRRTIEAPQNAVTWLSKYRKPQGTIWDKNSRKILDQVYAIAGYKAPKSSIPKSAGGPLKGLKAICDSPERPTRIHDGLRHSAVSYRLKHLQNPSKVAFWSGHSEAVMHKHYKGLCSDLEAKIFWAITPDSIVENDSICGSF